MMGPIFGIGLPKTGSKSLAVWLEKGFGIPAHHLGGRDDLLPERFEDGHFYIDHQRIWIGYRELAEEYPNAKFLLTWRPRRDWLISRLVHTLYYLQCNVNEPWAHEARQWGPDRLIEQLTAEYEQHYASAEEFCQNNPRCLLLLLGDWQRENLEQFLGRPCTCNPPHEYDGLDKLKEMLRAYVPSDK